MKQCPKCESTNISKERWNDAYPNAPEIEAVAAHGKTSDLKCNDCGYSASSECFEEKE